MFDPHFQRTTIDRIDSDFAGMVIHNENSKLPGHKERMLAHFKRIHEELKPITGCTCGICLPNTKFDWARLAESLVV